MNFNLPSALPTLIVMILYVFEIVLVHFLIYYCEQAIFEALDGGRTRLLMNQRKVSEMGSFLQD